MKWEKTTLKHQIAGLRERFQEALAEANATRDALDGYKDVQRVEFQKRLLCAQVLELEASLAEKEEESARVAERARERERELLERAKAGARLSSTGQLGGVADGVLLPAKDCSTVAPAPGTPSAPLTVPPRVQGARDLLLRG